MELPYDVLWHIVEYSDNHPLTFMLVSHKFAACVMQYCKWTFHITADTLARASLIGKLKHIIVSAHDNYTNIRTFDPISLQMYNHHITDANVLMLRRLTSLIMPGHLITNAALAQLTALTQLDIMSSPQITSLYTLTNITDLSICHDISIAHMPLVRLNIQDPPHCTFTEPISHTTLRQLILRYTMATGYDKLPLQLLSLDESDRDNMSIAAMTTLTHLILRNDEETTKDEIIGLSPTLLTVDYCPGVTDRSIITFTRLRELYAIDCDITGRCLGALTNLTKLTFVYDKNITDRDNDEFDFDPLTINNSIAAMTALTHLDISFSRINDCAVRGLTNLTTLILNKRSLVTDAGIHALTNLTSLELHYNRRITDAGVAHLTSLKSIEVRGCKLTADCVYGIYDAYTEATGNHLDVIRVHVGKQAYDSDSDYSSDVSLDIDI